MLSAAGTDHMINVEWGHNPHDTEPLQTHTQTCICDAQQANTLFAPSALYVEPLGGLIRPSGDKDKSALVSTTSVAGVALATPLGWQPGRLHKAAWDVL